MRVWRIAHRDIMRDYPAVPAGPYMSGPFLEHPEIRNAVWDLGVAHSGDDHPSPHYDTYLQTIRDHELCACDSRESLVSWFDGFLDRLGENGFIAHEYEVEDVRIGRTGGQVVFDYRTARLVGSYELHELEKV